MVDTTDEVLDGPIIGLRPAARFDMPSKPKISRMEAKT